MDAREQLLRDLTEAHGVPGHEGQAREAMRKALSGVVSDIEQDNLGSLIARLPGSSERPRIMLGGHLDEIGFMVAYITDGGFVRFLPLGGWWDQVLLAHEVIIKTGKGDVVGVIGAKAPHGLTEEERGKVLTKDNMFIDVGVSSRREAEELGVCIGDPIVPRANFTVLANGRSYMSKAFDDRVGCALVVDVLKELAGQPHPNTVYGVGTVQEEQRGRGAYTSGHVVDPDVFIALETGRSGDLPSSKPEDSTAILGGGTVINVLDSSLIPNIRLRRLIAETAKDAGVPVQHVASLSGGSDAGIVHLLGRGVPSVCLGVPTRYIHCHQGILRRDDYDTTVRLLVEVVKRLDAAMVADIRKN